MRVSKYIGKTMTYINVQMNSELSKRLLKGGKMIRLLGMTGYARGRGWFRFWGNPKAEGRDLALIAKRVRRIWFRLLEAKTVASAIDPLSVVRVGIMPDRIFAAKRIRPVKIGYVKVGTQMRKMPVAINRAMQACEGMVQEFLARFNAPQQYEPQVRFAHRREALPKPVVKQSSLQAGVKALQAKFSRQPEEAFV